MHLIGKSLVMRTRAAAEGRPYTRSGVGAGLRARPISPNNRLLRHPPDALRSGLGNDLEPYARASENPPLLPIHGLDITFQLIDLRIRITRVQDGTNLRAIVVQVQHVDGRRDNERCQLFNQLPLQLMQLV